MVVNDERKPVIIIPAYCPDNRLLKLINEIRYKTEFPIVVIDDGSGEKYENIFKEANKISKCLICNNKINMGKGVALKNAVKYAMDKYPDNCGYITCDADGQHSVDDIINIAYELKKNRKDIILGVRDFSSNNVPFKSWIGNRTSSILYYFITRRWCSDTQTGLRGIPRDNENDFISEIGDRYEFEMNFLTSSAKKNIKFKEVKIKTIYIDNNKSSHYRPIIDSVRIFSGLLKYTFSSAISAGVDLIVFTLLNTIVFKGYSFGVLTATIIARVFSGIVNFTINKEFVFNSYKNNYQALKYFILFIAQMILSGVIVSAITIDSVNTTIIKLVVDSILFFISYFIQKKVVFV